MYNTQTMNFLNSKDSIMDQLDIMLGDDSFSTTKIRGKGSQGLKKTEYKLQSEVSKVYKKMIERINNKFREYKYYL